MVITSSLFAPCHPADSRDDRLQISPLLLPPGTAAPSVSRWRCGPLHAPSRLRLLPGSRTSPCLAICKPRDACTPKSSALGEPYPVLVPDRLTPRRKPRCSAPSRRFRPQPRLRPPQTKHAKAIRGYFRPARYRRARALATCPLLEETRESILPGTVPSRRRLGIPIRGRRSAVRREGER